MLLRHDGVDRHRHGEQAEHRADAAEARGRARRGGHRGGVGPERRTHQEEIERGCTDDEEGTDEADVLVKHIERGEVTLGEQKRSGSDHDVRIPRKEKSMQRTHPPLAVRSLQYKIGTVTESMTCTPATPPGARSPVASWLRH